MTTPTPRSELIEVALREIRHARQGIQLVAQSFIDAGAPESSDSRHNLAVADANLERVLAALATPSAVGAPVVEEQPYVLSQTEQKVMRKTLLRSAKIVAPAPIPPAPVDLGEVEADTAWTDPDAMELVNDAIDHLEVAAYAWADDKLSGDKERAVAKARATLREEITRFAGGKDGKFKIGDEVHKIKGAQWRGRVVGTYSTALTPEGYAVESSTEIGSVQIYPVDALSTNGEAA